jgi:hypothetical protein
MSTIKDNREHPGVYIQDTKGPVKLLIDTKNQRVLDDGSTHTPLFYLIAGLWDRRYWRGGRDSTTYLLNILRARNYSFGHSCFIIFKGIFSYASYLKFVEIYEGVGLINPVTDWGIALICAGIAIWLHRWGIGMVKTEEEIDRGTVRSSGLQQAIYNIEAI